MSPDPPLSERDAALRRRTRVRWAGLVVALAVVAGVVLLSGGTDEGEDQEPGATKPSPPPKVACGADRPTAADPGTYDRPPPFELDRQVDYAAVITTSCGDIVMDLLEDEAPRTVNNFVFLAREGFYDGLTFHRVEQNSIIQGGDPEGTGRGGPGYTIPDEFPKSPDEYVFGTVGMANEGPGTAGSQFFIVVHDPDPDPQEVFELCTASEEVCLERRREAEKDARVDEPAGYRPDYAIFGRVDPTDENSVTTLGEIATLETKIGNDPTTATQPVTDVYIESIEIFETEEG